MPWRGLWKRAGPGDGGFVPEVDCLRRRRAIPRQEQPVFVQHMTGHVPGEMHRRLQARWVHSAVELQPQTAEWLQR